MNKSESLEEFYQSFPSEKTEAVLNELRAQKTLGHFNVYHREDLACRISSSYTRRDFYKISFIIGEGVLHYAQKSIVIDKPALLFSNPNVPYSWEATSALQSGFFCVFTEAFLNRQHSLDDSPLFKIGSYPLFFVEEKQQADIASVFQKMLDEISSAYVYKYDLLRNYVNLLIHEALKLKPAENYVQHTNASARITSLFVELLERQFPIDSPQQVFTLKSANDYALRLSVHVNHLNRAIKEITGKTTTEHIADRVVQEAKALLRHTDWPVSDIAYSLGFEYPAYFNNFFKKQTRLTPTSFKSAAV